MGKNGTNAQKSNHDEAVRDADGIGHHANVNQVRDEPMPSSRHDDLRREAVVRNEQDSGPAADGSAEHEVDGDA